MSFQREASMWDDSVNPLQSGLGGMRMGGSRRVSSMRGVAGAVGIVVEAAFPTTFLEKYYTHTDTYI